jgi:hypothetical protein
MNAKKEELIHHRDAMLDIIERLSNLEKDSSEDREATADSIKKAKTELDHIQKLIDQEPADNG